MSKNLDFIVLVGNLDFMVLVEDKKICFCEFGRKFEIVILAKI